MFNNKQNISPIQTMRKVIYILFLIITPTAAAQHWVGPQTKITFENEEYSTTDRNFIHILDSLVLKSQCINKRLKEKYFTMYFKKIKERHYEITLELYQLPIGDGSLGHLNIENHFFFLRGEIPDNLFSKSKNVKKFSYQRGTLCITEEFPYWLFDYYESSLSLKQHYCD